MTYYVIDTQTHRHTDTQTHRQSAGITDLGTRRHSNRHRHTQRHRHIHRHKTHTQTPTHTIHPHRARATNQSQHATSPPAPRCYRPLPLCQTAMLSATNYKCYLRATSHDPCACSGPPTNTKLRLRLRLCQSTASPRFYRPCPLCQSAMHRGTNYVPTISITRELRRAHSSRPLVRACIVGIPEP